MFHRVVEGWNEVRVEGRGGEEGAPRMGRARREEGQNFALFFHLPQQFSFFFPLLGVSSRNFGGVLKRGDPQMCTFGVLGLSCETPAALGLFGKKKKALHPCRKTSRRQRIY